MRCSYCHDDLGGLNYICQCGAIYHEECKGELKKCATLGCPNPLKTSKIEPPRSSWFNKLIRAMVTMTSLPLLSRIEFENYETPTPPRNTESGTIDKINIALKNPTLENLNDII